MVLSSLDGRYARDTELLREYFSEFAFFRGRVQLEISYLIALSQNTELLRRFTPQELETLERLRADFSLDDAQHIKSIEASTRHDVKAIENYLAGHLLDTSLADTVSWLHFGLTSDDVNLTALAIALRESRDLIFLPALEQIIFSLSELAKRHKSTVMLARTHGQAAVPTTFGKEMAVYVSRLERQRQMLSAHIFESKWSGAVGNANAFVAGVPDIEWPSFCTDFLKGLGVRSAPISTQIIPYDNWLEYFQTLQLINGILLDLAGDMWRYISDDYLKLRLVQDEVGSSTMPQKVNPIDFENAEGNLGLANSLFEFYIRKLPVSRLQRDLSDSTVRRSFGTALGHTLIAWRSIARGLDRVEVHEPRLRSELESHWEVIAEGAQTILRSTNDPSAYQQLKNLTRGVGISPESYHQWVNELNVDKQIKARLRALSPQTYIGLAEEIVENIIKGIDEI